MGKAKDFKTPMSPITCLEPNSTGRAVEEKLYRGIFGSLLYLEKMQADRI